MPTPEADMKEYKSVDVFPTAEHMKYGRVTSLPYKRNDINLKKHLGRLHVNGDYGRQDNIKYNTRPKTQEYTTIEKTWAQK